MAPSTRAIASLTLSFGLVNVPVRLFSATESGADIPNVAVSRPGLQLALQLVDQIAADSFDPGQFHDQEKQRVLAAIGEKVRGRKIVASSREEHGPVGGGQVIELMEALRASLGAKPAGKATRAAKAGKTSAKVTPLRARKADKRASAEPAPPAAAPVRRARARP